MARVATKTFWINRLKSIITDAAATAAAAGVASYSF